MKPWQRNLMFAPVVFTFLKLIDDLWGLGLWTEIPEIITMTATFYSILLLAILAFIYWPSKKRKDEK